MQDAWKLETAEAKRAAHEIGRISNVVQWAYTDEPLYDFQRAFLDDVWTARLLIKKTRQCGFSSRMSAAKGLVKALSIRGYKKIFTSHNMSDCKEKILWANDTYDRILMNSTERDKTRIPTKVLDNVTELAFSNGSRLISVFIPRGKDAADLDNDEFAHYKQPRKIWKASQPILIHPGVQSVVASSPTYSQHMFSQMCRREGGKFSQYKRAMIYWWDCPLHCHNVSEARLRALDMPTEERVFTFGSETLRAVYDSMFLEDFQEEFELTEADDKSAFLPWSLIVECSPAVGEGGHDPYSSLSELRKKARGRELFAGFDVGRRRDKSELSIFVKEGKVLVERYVETLERVPFRDQRDTLRKVCRLPNLASLRIDSTGMGEQIAEDMELDFGGIAEGVKFTNPSKHTMATGMRRLMELGQVRFVADRDRNYQMHSVKKNITAVGNITLDVEVSEDDTVSQHHADVFWSRALAIRGYTEVAEGGLVEFSWVD